MTPFRSEKNTNWEGAFGVPCLVRWPGHIKPGTVTCELMSHNDWIPTLPSWVCFRTPSNAMSAGRNITSPQIHLKPNEMTPTARLLLA
jgi:arylsulfatase A-like enzyme